MERIGADTRGQIGASYLSLKNLAGQYQPDLRLAQLLWGTKKREEQIVACFLFPVHELITEKKYTEIADELSISVNTVKTHISKAYRLIRGQLHSEESLILWYWLMSQSTCLKSEMNIRL